MKPKKTNKETLHKYQDFTTGEIILLEEILKCSAIGAYFNDNVTRIDKKTKDRLLSEVGAVVKLRRKSQPNKQSTTN